jgi:hypothetical protein
VERKERPPGAARRQGAGYHVLITRDRAQLSDPAECDAIKKSGLHHVRYKQGTGASGLALALASLIAAMPVVAEELHKASSQRLVLVTATEANRRFKITDPKVEAPSVYWPR